MSIVTPERIRTLQRKLYTKAKQEPEFRFYALYDKLCRDDVLGHAYRLVRSNRGAPGVDGLRFADIEAGEGETRFVQRLREQLKRKTYRADAVRRVWIPKPDGGKRPLGIPTIQDRVVQMAAKRVVEPIFEADFCEHSYGFRPKRSAHDAVDAVADGLRCGHVHVIDADLSKYFDTIPHANLLAVVAEKAARCTRRVMMKSFRIFVICISLLFALAKGSVAETPLFSGNERLTIPTVNTTQEIAKYQDIVFGYTEEGGWQLLSFDQVGLDSLRIASLTRVESVVTETFPVQVFLRASGYLSSPCISLGQVNHRLRGNQFTVVMNSYFSGEPGLGCPAVAIPFQETVPLPVYGLSAGSYSYEFNGIAGVFELAMDNELSGDCGNDVTCSYEFINELADIYR